MNCREAQQNLFADRERTPEVAGRAAFEQHVAQCANCRRIQADLAAAFTSWRSENAAAPLPDVEREWHAVRRKIRGGVETGTPARPARPRHLFAWIAVPLGAAAALAVAFFVGPFAPKHPHVPSAPPPAAQVARADSVEVQGNASTLVYVDDKSGWLIVWASDANHI